MCNLSSLFVLNSSFTPQLILEMAFISQTRIDPKIRVYNRSYYRAEYICDTDADFANLPVANIGSTALSITLAEMGIVLNVSRQIKNPI